MALLWELRWAVCFSDLPSAGAGMISSGSIGSLGGVGCWDLGRGGVFCGGVFRFGKKHFGAAYHLRDECHILNILWSDGAW